MNWTWELENNQIVRLFGDSGQRHLKLMMTSVKKTSLRDSAFLITKVVELLSLVGKCNDLKSQILLLVIQHRKVMWNVPSKTTTKTERMLFVKINSKFNAIFKDRFRFAAGMKEKERVSASGEDTKINSRECLWCYCLTLLRIWIRMMT